MGISSKMVLFFSVPTMFQLKITTEQWKILRIRSTLCFALALVLQLVECLQGELHSKWDRPLKFVPWVKKVHLQIQIVLVQYTIITNPCYVIDNIILVNMSTQISTNNSLQLDFNCWWQPGFFFGKNQINIIQQLTWLIKRYRQVSVFRSLCKLWK